MSSSYQCNVPRSEDQPPLPHTAVYSGISYTQDRNPAPNLGGKQRIHINPRPQLGSRCQRRQDVQLLRDLQGHSSTVSTCETGSLYRKHTTRYRTLAPHLEGFTQVGRTAERTLWRETAVTLSPGHPPGSLREGITYLPFRIMVYTSIEEGGDQRHEEQRGFPGVFTEQLLPLGLQVLVICL